MKSLIVPTFLSNVTILFWIEIKGVMYVEYLIWRSRDESEMPVKLMRLD